MLNEKGMDRQDVLNDLNKIIAADSTYSSGQPIASMSTIPHELGAEVFTNALEKNAGRLHTFKGSGQIEQEVIGMIANLLQLDKPFGTTTSGGTESNILAMLAARETSKKVSEPEMIAPKTVHASIDKAAWLLGIKLVKTRVDKEFKAIPKYIEQAISERTIGIIATAGTTYLGQIDPIHEIGRIASEHRLPLHVDAAFGGFVVPFLNDLGYYSKKPHEFDFSVKGVTSISTDPHKMGLAPIPAGTLIFRKQRMLKAITRKVPYLQGESSKQASILGTRPAGPILATWAIMKHLGREGYRRVVDDCMKRTNMALDRIRQIPLLEPAIQPVMNIIGIKSSERPIADIVSEMEKRGWRMATSPLPPTMRLVVMPHITEGSLNALFNDLESIACTVPS